MPRKRKTQPGSSGGAYSNRKDLTQPVSAPTGLPYGQRQAMEQAQQQAPLPQQASMDQVLAAAQGHQFQPVGLNAPTQRPHEPVTQGLPLGPGAGPEVLRGMGRSTSAQLRELARSTGDTSIADLANNLEQYGL